MDFQGIDCLGIHRVLKRGTGEILFAQEDALLVRDTVSGAYMLACEDPAVGLPLLDRWIGRGCDLLMVTDRSLGLTAYERYGFSVKLECFQSVYFAAEPPPDPGLTVRTADESDLPMLTRHYRLISPADLEKVVTRKSMLIGSDGDRTVGFMGEHLDGSMGLLYVFPECRRRGYGAALQSCLIAKTMAEGFIPLCQVEKENLASLNLQKKLGMTLSDRPMVWMWNEP